MNTYSKAFLLLLALAVGVLGAKEPVKREAPPIRRGLRTAAPCLPPTASAQLDVNNIRTILHNGGDMWWDLVTNPRYEVPKGSGKHSLFAGSLWIGGLDKTNNLRIAAQTYRQNGYDFWPGPLNQGEAAVDDEICTQFDRMYKINKTEIDQFRAAYAAGDGSHLDEGRFPNVYEWPAGANSILTNIDGEVPQATLDGTVFYLAPFTDVGGEEFNYEPAEGDFPEIQGDQAVWWIINDKGDVHTATGGEPIGVEIHMLAFAFTTSNAVNNMTFYRQTVINRSNLELEQAYIGQWVDPDVGFFQDDYVGCDTTLGLGFCFNGDANDEGANGYGVNPPSVGVDFFQGPIADPGDGVDNDKDGEIDEEGETIIMSKFVYYNNDFTLTGNPDPRVATHYYGYLNGTWKDGTPIVDNYSNGGNGNGYGPSSPGDPTNYMFSGDACAGQGWTEKNAGNPPADRRFIQSAGPFTLQPGAVNEIVTGVVWARGFFRDEIGSVCEMLDADRVAQALFDNNFRLLEGPDAPEVTKTELDRTVLLNWTYTAPTSNNFNESYSQADPVLKANGVEDSTFEFQGYIVYQLIDQTVSANELGDADRARVVLQSDIKDGIGTIVNRESRAVEGFNEPLIVDEVKVQGADEGIRNSVVIREDLFAQGDDRLLKNYTTYYYTVIAYAYNDTTSDGQRFIQGNGNFRVINAMPHPIDFKNQGTILNAEYGDELSITQVAGLGNGGNFVRLSEETENRILESNAVEDITYAQGAAPITVTVTNPLELRQEYYQLRVPVREFLSASGAGSDACGDIVDSTFVEWELYASSSPDGPFDGEPIYQSTYSVRSGGCDGVQPPRPTPLIGDERYIAGRGISISVTDVGPAGDTLVENTGVIGGQIEFSDPTQRWLTGLPDINALAPLNWIQGGTDEDGGREAKGQRIYDRDGDFSSMLQGWAPFSLARGFNNSPSATSQANPGIELGSSAAVFPNNFMNARRFVSLAELNNVDVVITPDQSKWSKCMVIETSPNSELGSGAWLMSGKWANSIDDPNEIANDPETRSTRPRTPEFHGFSWFPGYAVDVNTGERLNIFFGESTWDPTNRGNDMVWNPTADFGANFAAVGGRHYIYVTNRRYDEFDYLSDTLLNATNTPKNATCGVNQNGIGRFAPPDCPVAPEGKNLASVYQYVSWVGVPLLTPGFDIANPTEIPSDVRISLRVNQPFAERPGETEMPIFEFNAADKAPQLQVTELAESELENIRVVPNPYYAYSAYETGQLSNIVKITNLPRRCRISLFTLNGQLVRTFNKESDQPDQEWDLKNDQGVPIASGTYIVHVDAFDLGEKTIKMLVVMRRIDLNSF